MALNETGPPHGFELPPEDDRLLRGPPPEDALRWCAAAIGPAAEVVRVEPLHGGTSSAVHALDVRDAGGGLHRLVLRRFVRADWLAEEPDAPRREAAALEAVGESPLPTPRLVALDAAAPALLMTRLDGSIEWKPADLEGFLRRLAEVLPRIHATPVPADLPDYDPYELRLARPPSWSARPKLWRRAFEIFRGPAPSHERRFIHRDYHPGNVLWTDGAVSGIVDWASASAGAPEADVGHCRVNLAGAIGIDAADRFLELYRELVGGSEYDAYWDVVALLGGHDEDAFEPQDEDFLAHAIEPCA